RYSLRGEQNQIAELHRGLDLLVVRPGNRQFQFIVKDEVIVAGEVIDRLLRPGGPPERAFDRFAEHLDLRAVLDKAGSIALWGAFDGVAKIVVERRECRAANRGFVALHALQRRFATGPWLAIKDDVGL